MFGWTYLDATGEAVGESRQFPDAEAAEEWIGSCWPDLLENGVEEVVLQDRGRRRDVYRMGLAAE
jgi:hypothetical protein